MKSLGLWQRALGWLGMSCAVTCACLHACSDTPSAPVGRDASTDAPSTEDRRALPGVDAATDAPSDAAADRNVCVSSAPPLCALTATWGSPARVFASGARRFAAVSPDELHIAWFEGSALEASTGDAGAPSFARVADRANMSAAFGEGVLIGQEVDSTGLGLSPDGLFVVTTRDGIPMLSARARLDAAFADPRPIGSQETTLRAPVVAPDEGVFFTLHFVSPGQLPFTFFSKVGADFLQTEVLVPAAEMLATSSTQVPRPTGMSKDFRTLFFYDEVRKVERAALRAGPGCAFTSVVDLGNFPEAQPNADCSALYYRDPTATGSDIVRAPRNP